MCGSGVNGDHPGPTTAPDAEPFPWADIAGAGPLCDAHCHPTDTVASLAGIPAMHAAVLTVMATRAQDQDLVAQLATEQGVQTPFGDGDGDGDSGVNYYGLPASNSSRKVVPAFGWHPWFAHLLYDDDVNANADGRGDSSHHELTSLADKRRHLAAVLHPSPSLSQDDDANDKNSHLTRARLEAHPRALVGEIGLDKAFRVPEAGGATEDQEATETAAETDGGSTVDPALAAAALTPGGREGRLLSPFRVRPAHQVAVLAAQLRLAAALRRPISVHGVQAHGLLYDTLAATWRGQERRMPTRRQRKEDARAATNAADASDSDDDDDNLENELNGNLSNNTTPPTYPPAICLHSYTGPPDVLRQYFAPHVPAAVYVSFSATINGRTDAGRARLAAAVAACPDDRVLVESDLHTAGPQMDAALAEGYRQVCEAKGWPLREGIARIARNYAAFLAAGQTHDTRSEA
ncbi:cut9 interacting protein [Niveomyces insectorum RCEF 264]|uniref:Cut9 interacting protein n=1 Tax=Niveomyces insectorum RCEF 264 TaxID=1081102 RepID=A0A167PIZ1_9HYPO|nr:cut9 interacting protein [Niveomyces insectorum RCEF 264]